MKTVKRFSVTLSTILFFVAYAAIVLPRAAAYDDPDNVGPPRPLQATRGMRPMTVFPDEAEAEVGHASSGARKLGASSQGNDNERKHYSRGQGVGDQIVRGPIVRSPAQAARGYSGRSNVQTVSGHGSTDRHEPIVSGVYTPSRPDSSAYPPSHSSSGSDTRRPTQDPQRGAPYGPSRNPAHGGGASPQGGRPSGPSAQGNLSPNALSAGTPSIGTASFQGIIPGTSTIAEVEEHWGAPLNIFQIDGLLTHLYSIDIFNHIEVQFKDNRVRTITILFEEAFSEEQVRASFRELQLCKAVMIPNENDEIIGEVFPEKGILFLFEPEVPSRPGFWVSQIAIEPVTAEPFVLRAEALLTEQPTEALRDLLEATRLDPNDAKAHGLLAQVQLLQGNIDAALVNCEQAIRLEEQRPAYHITLAKIYIQMNRPEEARQYLEETIHVSDRYPHEKAQALTLLGDLYRTGAQPDYDAAINYHSDAIRLASTLQHHHNSTIRLAAKETLFHAHLGAARDIAWGQWNDKEDSINKWLSRAKEISRDPEVVNTKRISADFPLQLAVTTLATQVGFPATSELEPYVKEVIFIGDELINKTSDPILKRKYQWETGLALYDAVQIFQIRRDYTPAVRYGELTVRYMEAGIVDRRSDTDLYLLGRLYFRLGAIYAIGRKNHSAAIEWFDRAKPVFERLLPKINPEELGRLGETLVSMGVSYWEMNQRDEAVQLSERGLRQIEKGVRYGVVDSSALVIPYSNLSTMYTRLNRSDEAEKYLKMAENLKTSSQDTIRR